MSDFDMMAWAVSFIGLLTCLIVLVIIKRLPRWLERLGDSLCAVMLLLAIKAILVHCVL